MIIGRKPEQKELLDAVNSEYSKFVAVYGRRRVGKTFLIRETFNYSFTFQHTGLARGKMKDQLLRGCFITIVNLQEACSRALPFLQ